MIVRDSYAWASPYTNADPERLYSAHFRNLYGCQFWKAGEFAECLSRRGEWPEVFLFNNFSPERTALKALCRKHGINFAFWEEGFFPHYETQHLDPVGFCWESSLTGMVFHTCSDRQRARARSARDAWLASPRRELSPVVRPPFVLWPLQLIGDRVNVHDLNVPDWAGLVRDFRARIPAEVQLVLKEHPRAKAMDTVGLAALVNELPHTVMVPPRTDLQTLLGRCQAVAGVNSSVLHEARLMHHKPAYAYGRSWFTNHDELVVPLARSGSGGLPHVEWIEAPSLLRTDRLDDYTDWFLAQLLARQIDRRQFTAPAHYREAIWRLSDHAYRQHGEVVFDS